MTGFGRYELSNERRKVIIEMKAVNHRYCDINIRLPKTFNQFENPIRTIIKQGIIRGKIDVFISFEDYIAKSNALKYNEQLASEYMKYFSSISEQFNIENDMTVSKLTRYPEVLILEEQAVNEDELWNDIKVTVQEAIKKIVEARVVEGQLLKNDLELKLNSMLELLKVIKKRSPELVSIYKHKLENRLKELLNEPIIDENRLAIELAVFSDKSCIDEEIVRLESHIVHMEKILNSKEEGIGRKLDFIAQEMNREANTILSKATDLDISNTAINLKNEIEKIREQIQNIE